MNEDFDNDSKKESEEPQEQERYSLVSMWLDLPTALQRHVTYRFLMAFLLAFVGVLLCLHIRSMHGMILVLLAAYIIWSAISVISDWHNGGISELVLTCVSVEPQGLNARTRVTMITSDIPPKYHIYYLPGGRKDSFPPNVPCLVYVKDSAPDRVIAWMAL